VHSDSGSIVLLNLVGEVALLLWGMQLISNGVQRAFGDRLRQVLAVGLRTRGSAFLAGLAVTGLLQSSTATALLVSSLSAGGSVDLVPALAVMLGANVGTTLIVQVMAFDISAVVPMLLLVSYVANRRAGRAWVRDAGSAVFGLALVLLALHMLLVTMRPIEGSSALQDLLRSLTSEPVLNVLLAAILSWAAHSSVAAMLFIISLASAGLVTPQAALAMVIGANLGSAMNPVIAGLGGDAKRMRVPMGNLLTRVVGCVVALPLVPAIVDGFAWLGEPPGRMAADFHMAFNVVLAIAFIGLLPQIGRVLRSVYPERLRADDPGSPQYLDEAALGTPSVALSNAAREILRMVDVVESMLHGSQDAFASGDRAKIAQVSKMDDVLDRLNGAIQRYIGAVRHDTMNEDESRRASEILAVTINLEHIGDIIDKNLMELAAKRVRLGLTLGAEAATELEELHARLIEHLHLAVAVFMFADAAAARRLVAEKEGFRDTEREVTKRHLERMRSGDRTEVAISALQLDITRDLKRIEAHIAATAHGVLEKTGDLRSSRLRSE
jgi:phosphate:Na+ symporter